MATLLKVIILIGLILLPNISIAQKTNSPLPSSFGITPSGLIVPKNSDSIKLMIVNGNRRGPLTLERLIDSLEESPSCLYLFIKTNDNSLWVKAMVALKKDGFETQSINHSIDVVSVTTTKATVSLSSYSPKTDRSSPFYQKYGYFEYVELPYKDEKIKLMVDTIADESNKIVFIRFVTDGGIFRRPLDGTPPKLTYMEYYVTDDCKKYFRDTINLYNSLKK